MNENTSARKWKFSDIGIFLKNSFLAILQGRFLLRLKIDKYFVHIVYVFFLMAMLILISLGTENTLNKVEENKKTIKELKIICSDKTFEVADKSRRATVEETLEIMGSALKEPAKSAIVLKK